MNGIFDCMSVLQMTRKKIVSLRLCEPSLVMKHHDIILYKRRSHTSNNTFFFDEKL